MRRFLPRLTALSGCPYRAPQVMWVVATPWSLEDHSLPLQDLHSHLHCSQHIRASSTLDHAAVVFLWLIGVVRYVLCSRRRVHSEADVLHVKAWACERNASKKKEKQNVIIQVILEYSLRAIHNVWR